MTHEEGPVEAASQSGERREFRRLTLPIPTRFRLQGSPVVRRGMMVNISSVGGALLTPVPLPKDSAVEELRFSLPPVDGQEGVRISVSAGIVATEQQRFADSSERYRASLVFLNLKGEAFEAVCRVIGHELDQSGKSTARESSVERSLPEEETAARKPDAGASSFTSTQSSWKKQDAPE
jgi:hypothetical protein